MASVVIYTLRGCPYCVRARELLESKGTGYREVDVTADYAERVAVCGRTGHRTFPQVFIDGRFVGGCDELHSLERAGRLDGMLA